MFCGYGISTVISSSFADIVQGLPSFKVGGGGEEAEL